MQQETVKTNYSALSTLTSVFFFWGFIAAGNSIFIPFCKNFFHLDQFQSQLIDFAFYLAYYIGALILFMLSSAKRKDIVLSWGYKRSIVFGLLFSALGAVAMIVSVYFNVFAGMLFGLFIVALGFSLQQTSANPFMIALGDEKTGSTRITFGGAVNSLGTTLGPVLISLALFGTAAAVKDEQIKNLPLSTVMVLYAAVGLLFIGVAALFGFSKSVPSGRETAVQDSSSEKKEILLDNDSSVETTENDKLGSVRKAMVSMLVITGLVFGSLAPVFNSYRSDEAKQLVELDGALDEIAQAEKENVAKFENKLISPDEAIEVASEKDALLKQKTKLENEKSNIKKPLEQNRMMWLIIGIVVVTFGILGMNLAARKNSDGWGAMKYPQLTLGMLAIFVYVGVEVAIGSNLAELLKQKEFGGYESSQITPFISLFWGSLMIGRWSGSVNAFNLSKNLKIILKLIVPYLALGVVLGFSSLTGYEIGPLKYYFICVTVLVAATFITDDRPVLSLIVLGVLGLAGVLIGMSTTGIVSVYAFLSAGLFCSVMWPCIFSLSLAGLGKYQAQGSGFLVMMILGGGLIPPLQGKLSDIVGIQASFFVGALCFAYIILFAIIVNRQLTKQGIKI
jgi:FHS family L-fucose permease-like MFS transporter